MGNNAKIIIFTDLDGTFLDHNTYQYTPALPALNRLHALKIPIIPVTSKTLAEITDLNLPFDSQFKVAENGMVISDGCDIQTAISYTQLIDLIKTLPHDLRQYINGFNDMAVNNIAAHTNMPDDKAALAKDRQASEPFLWSGDDKTMHTLKAHLDQHGVQITRGGRFYHMMAQNGGKDKAVQSIIQTYQNKHPNQPIISIALGDGPNDSAMLGCVDYGIKIPNENGHDFTVQNPRGTIIHAPSAGPTGWNQSITALLDQLHL